jgi:hypothetical protein
VNVFESEIDRKFTRERAAHVRATGSLTAA